ncbi:cytochrome P450 [Podospora australis]|uniref:Cytochrome P450 n=1 Tax=Podospora australis TaxID=1536484 RepID=A0AAN7AJZ3_9PEZI|nr:cytochrome P450 [Podospora australis]
MSLTFLFGALAGAATLILALHKLLQNYHDPREPPLAPQSIPFIGHLVGMSRRSFNYHADLARKVVGAPIYTMSLPGQKMYIATSSELVQAVQKQHKILAFAPLAAKFVVKICGMSQEGDSMIKKNLSGDEGNESLWLAAESHIHNTLKPGANLDDMNHSMIEEVVRELNELQPGPGKLAKIGMYHWLKGVITTATTRSVYGPMNPYDDKDIADAFWDFQEGIVALLLGILPTLTARKPTAAREKVVKAFVKYYQAGGHKQASTYARGRYELPSSYGMSVDDIARAEVSGSVAIMVNTAPATFWTLLLIHSHPGLLEEIRKEIDACTEITTDSHGKITKSLDITTLKTSCPLLLSTYQEVLRYRTMGVSIREVLSDTVVSGYLLKKGAMLQMPARVLHTDPNNWGPTVDEFDPRRFLPSSSDNKNRPRKDTCYRPFGGGKTLCPGRHFATNEVLAAVSLAVARFDMKPVKGKWELPSAHNTSAATVIMEPDFDLDVEVATRKGFEDVTKWDVTLKKSDAFFALVTEDQEFSEK